MIGAGDHFPQQAHQEKLYPDHDQQDGQQQRGAGTDPVRPKGIGAAQDPGHDLANCQIEADQRPQPAAAQAKQSKELHWTRTKAAQKGHGDQVEQHPRHARQVVLAAAVASRPIADGHLGHLCADLAHQLGDKAMHLAIEVHLADQVVAIGTQATPAIVQRNPRGTPDQGIGRQGRETTRQKRFLAVLSPTIDHVKVAMFHLGQEGRDVGRVVLPIGVHSQHDRAPRIVKTGGETGRLAEITAEAYDAQMRVTFGQCFQHLKGAVPAAIVDGNDLIAAP